MRLSDENIREGRHLTPEERIALQAEEIKQLWQENEQLRAQNTVIRGILARVLQVMEGFDYRANINFTLSDCLDVEKEAKALLKEDESV